ncbi:MAG TPA: hypothetical protein VN632_00145 [Stellaceae bacterium]|nr:hypothetical protein [Stellaceae bacterium]
MSWRWGPVFLAAILVLADAVPILALAGHLAPNADGFQHFLEIKSIWRGHVLLDGWSVAEDNFYLTDLPFYAVAAALIGLTPAMLPAVCATIFLLLVLVAAIVAVQGAARAGEAWFAAPAVVVLLGMPTAIWPFLAGGSHIATSLFILVQYALLAVQLRRAAASWRVLAPYAVFSWAALASDPLALFAANAPVAIFFALRAAIRADARRASLTVLGVTVAVTLLGWFTPSLVAAIGGFRTDWHIAVGFAAPHSFGVSFIGIGRFFARLAGAEPLFHPMPWDARYAIRAAFVAIVAAACISTVARPRRDNETGLLLLAGAAFLFAACTASRQFFDTVTFAGARYMAPGFFLATVAAAIELSRYVVRLNPKTWRVAALTAGAVSSAVVAVPYAAAALALRSQPPAIETMPHRQLAGWLIQHELSRGLGDFWTAHSVNALAHDKVTVETIWFPGGKPMRFDWVSSEADIVTEPQFVAFSAANSFGVSVESVRAGYGPIASVEHPAGFTVVILARSP